jgi:tripartite-type tricarboxylate transporter receptor subunit TctC
VKANAKAGRLRALALAAQKRVDDLPALPTMHEAGVANFEASVWNGVFAPAGTPRDIVTGLNNRINAATHELAAPLREIGGYPMHGTPEEFAEYFRREIIKWAKVVKSAGLKAE